MNAKEIRIKCLDLCRVAETKMDYAVINLLALEANVRSSEEQGLTWWKSLIDIRRDSFRNAALSCDEP